MKLPPEIEFHEDIRLLVYRPRGLIDAAAINKIIDVIEDIEAVTKEPLIDSPIHRKPMRLSSTSDTSFRFAFIGVSPRGSCAGEVSNLATDSTLVHYGRLLGLLTQGSSITVHVFQEREAAAKWLGVPVELLTVQE
jgi:hypothetical protein